MVQGLFFFFFFEKLIVIQLAIVFPVFMQLKDSLLCYKGML